LCDHGDANAVVASAQARGVPLVSARQMLQWLDARNSSAFNVTGWNGYALSFSIEAELWAQPIPLRLFLKTEIDLEDGNAVVVDAGSPG